MASNSNPNTPPWLPYAGLFLAICGMIYQGGVISSTVDQNTMRITKLEAVSSTQAETIQQINMRGASIQEKINFLVDDARARKEHK